MAEDRGTVRAIAWQEVFPGLTLLSALRMALNFRSLVLAAVAIVGTTAGWRICGRLLTDVGDSSERTPFALQVESNSLWPWEQGVPARSLDQWTSLETWRTNNPLAWAWTDIAAPVEHVYETNRSFPQLVYWLTCTLWSLLVWSFFGGAISRATAVTVARQENQSWGQLSSFVRRRFAAYFTAPLFPMLGTLLMAVFLAVLGLFMKTDAGVLVAGIVWPLVLLAGFMMAFLLIGLFFAWPLMWGAISAEGTDAFGALSHSYSYTYQRPLHYLLYAVIAAILGALGWYLVSVFADWTIALGLWGVSWGSGATRLDEIFGNDSLGTVGNAGKSLVLFWHHAVRTLAVAFIFSYFWTSTTVIYFLLRRLVDATEVDEVFMPEEQDLRGLPPLKTGPDGVPDVADDPVSAGDA